LSCSPGEEPAITWLWVYDHEAVRALVNVYWPVTLFHRSKFPAVLCPGFSKELTNQPYVVIRPAASAAVGVQQSRKV
jgi:hypothetical protein